MASFPRNDDLARRIEEPIKPKEDLGKLQKAFKKALHKKQRKK